MACLLTSACLTLYNQTFTDISDVSSLSLGPPAIQKQILLSLRPPQAQKLQKRDDPSPPGVLKVKKCKA